MNVADVTVYDIIAYLNISYPRYKKPPLKKPALQKAFSAKTLSKVMSNVHPLHSQLCEGSLVLMICPNSIKFFLLLVT